MGATWGYAVIDAAMAGYFWRQAQNRWFPAPLFYLHIVLIAFYMYVTLFGASAFWIGVVINRIFEIAILYVMACSVHSMRNRRPDAKRARI
ncbi:MAG: hypothetical protein R3C51_14400 [Parvularculaceae bacterium]